jgi:hypothetical protein
MNLFEILIVLLFIVFPLLQQVLGQRKGGEQPPANGEGEGEGQSDPARQDARGRGTTGSSAPAAPSGHGTPEVESWSVDWGAWPAQPGEDELVEAGTEEVPVEVPEPRRPSRVWDASVVSLEPLHVDRKAEHARFHARTAPVVRPVKERPPRIASLLRGREGLRRAVLLSEVLGLPTAFRELPGPPDRG